MDTEVEEDEVRGGSRVAELANAVVLALVV